MKTFLSIWLLAAIPELYATNLPGTTFLKPPTDDDPTNVFVRDTELQLGTEYPVQWSTNLTAYSVWLWQQIGDVSEGAQEVFVKDASEPEPFGFSWNISVGILPLARSNVYFLVLSNGTVESVLDKSERSTFFNLTENPVTATSIFPTVTSQTVTVPKSSSTFSTSTTTTTPTIPMDYSSPSQLVGITTTATTTTTPLSSNTLLPNPSDVPSTHNTSPSNSINLVSSLAISAGVSVIIVLAIFAGLRIHHLRIQKLEKSSLDLMKEEGPKSVQMRMSEHVAVGYKARLLRYWLWNEGVPVELPAERDPGELEG